MYRSDGIVINDGIWHHVCITWDVVVGEYVFYKDGAIVRKGVYARTCIPGGGVWVLGQDQDWIGGGFDKDDSFKGEMVETNIWNKVLTPQEILMMSRSCQANLPFGIIKSWKEFLVGVKLRNYIIFNESFHVIAGIHDAYNYACQLFFPALYASKQFP